MCFRDLYLNNRTLNTDSFIIRYFYLRSTPVSSLFQTSESRNRFFFIRANCNKSRVAQRIQMEFRANEILRWMKFHPSLERANHAYNYFSPLAGHSSAVCRFHRDVLSCQNDTLRLIHSVSSSKNQFFELIHYWNFTSLNLRWLAFGKIWTILYKNKENEKFISILMYWIFVRNAHMEICISKNVSTSWNC